MGDHLRPERPRLRGHRGIAARYHGLPPGGRSALAVGFAFVTRLCRTASRRAVEKCARPLLFILRDRMRKRIHQCGEDAPSRGYSETPKPLRGIVGWA